MSSRAKQHSTAMSKIDGSEHVDPRTHRSGTLKTLGCKHTAYEPPFAAEPEIPVNAEVSIFTYCF